MSKEVGFFKIRATKRSNLESRTTLDRLHNLRMEGLFEKEKSAETLREELKELRSKTPADDIELERYRKKDIDLTKELERRMDKNEIFDYFLDTGEILYKYYETQDKISSGQGVQRRTGVKAKPGSVLASLESAAASQPQPEASAPAGELHRRDRLLEEYLRKVDPAHARGDAALDPDQYGECDECGTEMIFSANEAMFTCANCGAQEFVLIDSDKPSYKDPPREVSYYAYKRINHFNEWLAQFQAKESTEIPAEVYDAIVAELKKERILDFRTLKQSKVREILKKLKYNKYYEHVPHIMNRLNGQTAPVMSREIEEKLRYMFKEIQPAFQKHCPKERSNFLSYSYVLYKFCELLELDEYLASFPLLKNRDKLYVQDKIWELICKELRWQFLRSV